MIIQSDSLNPNNGVSINQDNPSVLNVNTEIQGKVVKGDFDLSKYQGKVFRLYLDKSLSLIINQGEDLFWLLVEVNLPEKTYSYENENFSENPLEEPITLRENPLNLNNIDIFVYSLPNEDGR